MGWFLAAAVFLLTTAFVFRTSSPRNAFLIAACALLSIIAALVLFVTDDGGHGPRKTIPASGLTLSDVRLTTDRYGHQLTGRIANGTDRRLGTVTLKVTFRACPQPEACNEVGSESASVFMALPAGQTGGFSVLLARAGPLAKPDLLWNAEVVDAVADF
ncbi:MAG: hypothetical protein K2X62_05615 [Beijerinckiaceae bacterium]|jgi:hypothetical protein|nr:hypothetical protein [Beijerinckiaceae bacterium]MDO9441732.1 hypothetical protein [Beijerinckiaceae bacterium]